MGLARSVLRIKGPKEIKKPKKTPYPISSTPPKEFNQEMMKNLQSIYVESSSTTNVPVNNPYVRNASTILTADQIIKVLDSHRLKSSTLQELSQVYNVDINQLTHLVKYYDNFYVRNADKERDVKLKFHPLHR